MWRRHLLTLRDSWACWGMRGLPFLGRLHKSDDQDNDASDRHQQPKEFHPGTTTISQPPDGDRKSGDQYRDRPQLCEGGSERNRAVRREEV